MPFDLWTTEELMLLRRDDRMDAIPNFFLDTFFDLAHFSDDQEIKFAELPEADRFLAPFVLPTEQGKPIRTARAETIKAITPPYIKLVNGVRPTEARNLMPADALRNRGGRLTLEQRFNLRVQQLVEEHIRRVRTREAWMAARAILDAKIRIQYERDEGAALPDVELDFGRDANLTVIKSSGYWSDPTADILGDVETWANRMYLANGGGSPSQLIVGARVASTFRANEGILKSMDKTYRYNDANGIDFTSGIMRIQQPMKFIGRLDSGLDVWTYKDTVDIPNGSGGKTKIDLMDERDVLMVAPGASGVRAYGAIYDVDAIQQGNTQTDLFQKMYKSDDPGELFLKTDSSPLPIPLYPNRTFRARVLA